jgi:hypothetical protein
LAFRNDVTSPDCHVEDTKETSLTSALRVAVAIDPFSTGMVIALSLGLFGIIVGVAYWFAREEQKTIRKIPPEEMDEKERQARREALANISNFPPS